LNFKIFEEFHIIIEDNLNHLVITTIKNIHLKS
jgi:hypothetical protein